MFFLILCGSIVKKCEKKKLCLRLLGLLHGERPLSKELDVDSHHGELLQSVGALAQSVHSNQN